MSAGEIVENIPVDLAPSALALSPCGRRLYVACYVDGNPKTGTFSVICTKTNAVVGTLSGFSGPFSIALSPSGRKAYVTNFGSNNFAPYGTTVTIVDLEKWRAEREVEVGIQPAGVAASEEFFYVSTFNSLYAGPGYQNLTMGEGTVAIFRAKDGKAEALTPAGQSPSTLVLAPNGALYGCSYTGNVVKSFF